MFMVVRYIIILKTQSWHDHYKQTYHFELTFEIELKNKGKTHHLHNEDFNHPSLFIEVAKSLAGPFSIDI